MDPAAKQQIVDRIKQAENILVTISNDPSIDQLAACIGFTLMLNKMGKRATAIYSGKTPSVVDFLQPEKTLETNTDSLQDFIISLDKAKADKLRYKVEDQVVRIFITPYRTSLSEKDLIFSHGDFNIDVVVALGVENRVHIDKVIAAHGRILHDATVITVSNKQSKGSDLGQLNWQDPAASSISEMLVSVSEAFGAGLIDNQMATAFLTGIVAETERFSNEKTSPKVMTMSAQLMAAGANQQLVISKLEPPPPPPPPPKPKAPPPPPSKKPEPAPKAEEKPKQQEKKESKDKGELSVAHEASQTDGSEVEIDSKEIHIDQQGNLETIEGGQAKAEASTDKPQKKDESSSPPKDAPVPPPEPKKEEKPEPELPIPAPPNILPPPPVTTTPAPEPTPVAPLPNLPPVPLPPVASSVPPLPLKPSTPEPSTFPEHKTMGVPPPPPPPPVQYSPPSEPHQHSVMDPSQKPPSFGAPFTADTGQLGGSGGLPVDPLNIDPVNESDGNENYNKDHKTVAVPPSQQTPLDQLLAKQNPGFSSDSTPNNEPQEPVSNGTGVDSARNAVESAYAAVPFDPSLSPVASLGAQPMGPDFHNITQSAPNPTPLNPNPSTSPTSFPPTPPPPMPPPIPPIPPSAPASH